METVPPTPATSAMAGASADAASRNRALWGGRFATETNDLVTKLSESVSYDQRLYKHDILQSKAHVRMLAKQGLVSKDDADKCVAGLDQLCAQIENGSFGQFDVKLEDIHMNIESRLTRQIGEPGAKLHTARSRNDQVATDLRLYLRDEIQLLIALARSLQSALVILAERNAEVVMPGFTHLQHAQPVVLGHYFLAYCEMFDRDAGRLSDTLNRLDFCPLGSGAMATTTLPIDRFFTSEQLGFRHGPCRNSMDAVSDRDFALELLATISISMMHVSRISEDLIFWMSQEAGWIELGDAFCTGSSLMPQKKNPDVCELARGKTGRVYGNLLAALTMMKGLPLCYNRDMQEDKERLFDSIDTYKALLQVFREMLLTLKPHRDRMLTAASDPFLMATDLAEWLVRNGVPFREAHHRIGALVGECTRTGRRLNELTLAEMQRIVPEATAACLELFDPVRSVQARNVFGGPAPEQVRNQVQFWKKQVWFVDL
ncbi:hypothetical protein F1559_002426 [Cyanidiococcus yangmingshanensis]|uniref:Argininosuccinate lyase n=1 Tax=Cyanidiococcus yangmingshanensis TaxID=2690220 RepID=A0A7J7IIW8_9RHOD|nr:hypothetical protein F1559_002426 [Cyanidiococcus yangmingshanensis]